MWLCQSWLYVLLVDFFLKNIRSTVLDLCNFADFSQFSRYGVVHVKIKPPLIEKHICLLDKCISMP